MFKFLYKKNNKGTSNITRVLSYLLLFILFAFSLDVIFLLGQTLVVGYNSNYIANKLMVQGGLVGDTKRDEGSAEASMYFYGVASNKEIITSTNRLFKAFGINENDWAMEVDGKTLYMAGTPNYTVKSNLNYGEVADLTTRFKFRWRFTGEMLPGSQNMVFEKISSFTSDYYNISP